MKNNRLLSEILLWSMLFFGFLGLQACSDELTQADQPIIEKTANDDLPSDAPNFLVAVDAAYAPLVFRDENGQAIGFDVDILTAVGKDQGFRLTFIPTLWDGIFAKLDTGERDIVAGGVTITSKRQQTMGMSKPYISAPTLIIYTDADLQLHQLSDLRGLSVGVQVNSTFETELHELNAGSAADIRSEKTLFLAFKSLLNDEVQAVVGDAPVLRYYMAEYADVGKRFYSLEYTPDGQVDAFGFAVKQGNQKLLNKINLGLRNINASGEYEKIYKKWFR